MTRLAGPLEPGARLRVDLHALGMRPMTIRPRAIEIKPDRLLVWEGHLGFRGVFDGRHEFRLESAGSERTRFIHSERFRGLLVPVLRKVLETNTRAGFVAMNQALKQRAEQSAAAQHADHRVALP